MVWGEMLITQQEMAQLRSGGSRYGTFAVDCARKVVAVTKRMIGHASLPLPDPIAMAVAIDSKVCRTERLHVAVETSGELTRGETVVDRWGVLGKEPNVNVCFDPNPDVFKRILFQTLA